MILESDCRLEPPITGLGLSKKEEPKKIPVDPMFGLFLTFFDYIAAYF